MSKRSLELLAACLFGSFGITGLVMFTTFWGLTLTPTSQLQLAIPPLFPITLLLGGIGFILLGLTPFLFYLLYSRLTPKNQVP